MVVSTRLTEREKGLAGPFSRSFVFYLLLTLLIHLIRLMFKA